MELAILLADDGFYALYFAGLWYPICPYYTPKNKSISTLPVPPWAIDHIISDTLYDAEIRVMTAFSTPEHWKKVDANNIKKRVQYTQIVETDTTRQQVDYVVLVNMTLQQQHFDVDSEVRINFFNKALEFHDLFGTTVMRLKLTLQNGTLSFNSFINKEWAVKEQDKNYTFTIFEKLIDEKDNNTTDFFKKFTTTDRIITTTVINQSSINITTTDQSSINITTTDRIKLIPTNLSFQIQIMKSGFRVKLNDNGMDVNEQMLDYPAKVPVHDIQYITVEHKNITLANGTAVEHEALTELPAPVVDVGEASAGGSTFANCDWGDGNIQTKEINDGLKLADFVNEFEALALRQSLDFRVENDIFVLMLRSELDDQWFSRLSMLRDEHSTIRLAEFTGCQEKFMKMWSIG
uniref:Uncharacterized protein n=1 Tax=Globodera rostochiensis TaxID=31243 RepID=A0A914HN98_GLORO